MKLDIFTEEQSNYFIDNYEKLRQLSSKKEKINQSNENSDYKSRNIRLIMEQEKNLKERLEPFVARDKEYEQRVEKVYQAHGLSKEEFPDEMTLADIVKLQKEMKEESSEYTYDLQRKRNKDLEAMFKDNDKTQDLSELNAMFNDTDSKEEKNEFKKQFK